MHRFIIDIIDSDSSEFMNEYSETPNYMFLDFSFEGPKQILSKFDSDTDFPNRIFVRHRPRQREGGDQ